MEASVGNIVYTLDVNTSKFVQGMDKSDKQLDKFGDTAEKTDQKVAQFGGGLNRLAQAIAGLAIADKLRDMQKLSEEFTVLSARINRLSGDAAQGAENYRNLIDIASRSGSDLGTTVKVWESLTTSLTEFGHSNESITQVTESLMKMGAIGGSTADEMKNGLRQLGQSFSGGIVRAEEFNSVLENIPEVARQIAKGMGIPFSELRQQMLDGKLTSEVVLEALKKQAKEVDTEFAKMPRTVAQASNAIRNSFGDALSKLDQQSGFSENLAKAIDIVAKSLSSFSMDADSVASVLDGLSLAASSVAAVMAGRMLTALGASTAAMVGSMRAAIANSAAQKAAAAEAVRSSVVELAAARAQQQRAAATLAATSAVVQGTAARTVAVDAMAAADARAALAEKTLQAAMTQSAAVAGTTSIAMRALGTSMAFLGGPVGVALLAATAVYQFATAADKARDPTSLLAAEVEKLGAAQLRLQKINLQKAISDLDDAAKGGYFTQLRMKSLKEAMAGVPEGSKRWNDLNAQLTEMQAGSEAASKQADQLRLAYSRVVEEEQKRAGMKVNEPQAKQQKTNPEDLKVMDAAREALELANLEGEARARRTAEMKLSAQATDAERKAVGDLAVATYRLTEGRKADAKEAKASADEKAKVAKADVKHTEENKQAIIDYAIEVAKAAHSTQDLTEANALAKLNKWATPEDVRIVKEIAAAEKLLSDQRKNQELVKQLDPMVGATFDHQQQLENLKKLNEGKFIEDQRYLELKRQAEVAYNAEMQRMEVERFRAQSVGNEALMASLDALGGAGTNAISGLLSGTMSVQEATGNLANTVLNALIGSYVQSGIDFVKQEIAKRAAAKATEAAQVAGIGTVAAAQTGATATIASTTTGTAATTGSAVATSMAPAAGLASIASFGSAAVIGGAALIGTMALAKSFGGGRQYGGSMDSDKFYRINESGPEIFTDNSGKQYMTGANGIMTSNRDAFGQQGAQRPMQVIIENYGNDEVTATQEQLTDKDVIRIVVSSIDSGGAVGKSVNRATGTKRPGR